MRRHPNSPVSHLKGDSLRTVLRPAVGRFSDADAGSVTSFFRSSVNEVSVNVQAEVISVALEVKEAAPSA
jgi:hypothetical protein